VAGTWQDLTDAVELDGQQFDGPGSKPSVDEVFDAIASGNVQEDHGGRKGEMLELKDTMQKRWCQLRVFLVGS